MHELHRLGRDDRIEVVMESADRRGAQVQLMAFTDGLGRVYQQNPGKLVFYVRDIDAFTEQFENAGGRIRSEEHTSELQSRPHLVCRLLLEKKKNINIY